MAISTVKHLTQLDTPFVLAPERYDPRRVALNTSATRPLREIALLVRKTVSPSSREVSSCIVLDTSDAYEGVITNRKAPVTSGEIGSAKKVAQPNDVIISRLRPYLRQVAFVDAGVRHLAPGLDLLCSTEFLVLRSVDEQSIAFLVPFLLSDGVQRVLAAAQEGGHHPRFNDTTLLELPVPKALLAKRTEVSAKVQSAVKLYREFEGGMESAIRAGSVGQG